MKLLFYIFLYLYDAIAGTLFVASFTGAKKLIRRWVIPVVAAAIFISSPFYSVQSTIIPIDPNIIHRILSLILLYFFAFSECKGDAVAKIASPIIFEAVSLFTNAIAVMYFNANIISEISEVGYSGVAIVLATVAVAKILMTSILLVTLRIFSRDGSHRLLTVLTLSLSPIFALFTLYLYMKLVYFYTGTFTVEIYIAVTGTAILNLLTFILFDRTVKAEADNNRLQLYMNKFEMEKIRYSDIIKANNELRGVRHDLKNHLLILKKYSAEKDFEGIEKYITSFEESLNRDDFPSLSGNAMLDYIIASKMNSVKDVTCLVSGVFVDSIAIDDIDLAVLVGNIIDNAVDATSKLQRNEKLIEVNLSVFNGYQNFIVKNDIESSVIEKNRDLATTKKDKSAHGFGLRSVRSITEKYNGIFEYYEKDGKFCVQVALPINEKPEKNE
ncbi:MAG: GHKL domain-containing protein [Clostridia bacterium]|nr:GHKL domain-containing protein [Clostridia bacterium]